eukprot:5004104-Pyramimonas_sp.AAC.1
MAMVRARPPNTRCKAAACWEGVILPVVTLIQECTSRTNSRKGYLTGTSFLRRLRHACVLPHAQYIATQANPKIVTPTQWPRRS